MLGNDERLEPVMDASRKALVDTNYDPHYAGIEERAYTESRLFIARFDALMSWLGRNRFHHTATAMREFLRVYNGLPAAEPPPVPMVLFCPNCGRQHIDSPKDEWTNPPHRSHLCAHCAWVWRPADVPTTGVAEIMTEGKKDCVTFRGKAAIAVPTDDHYRRPECMFDPCPAVGLCQSDEKCRQPFSQK